MGCNAHRCSNFNGSLAKLLLKLECVWIISVYDLSGCNYFSISTTFQLIILSKRCCIVSMIVGCSKIRSDAKGQNVDQGQYCHIVTHQLNCNTSHQVISHLKSEWGQAKLHCAGDSKAYYVAPTIYVTPTMYLDNVRNAQYFKHWCF